MTEELLSTEFDGDIRESLIVEEAVINQHMSRECQVHFILLVTVVGDLRSGHLEIEWVSTS